MSDPDDQNNDEDQDEDENGSPTVTSQKTRPIPLIFRKGKKRGK